MNTDAYSRRECSAASRHRRLRTNSIDVSKPALEHDRRRIREDSTSNCAGNFCSHAHNASRDHRISLHLVANIRRQSDYRPSSGPVRLGTRAKVPRKLGFRKLRDDWRIANEPYVDGLGLTPKHLFDLIFLNREK